MSSSDPLNNLLVVLGQTISILALGIISRKFNWIPTDTSALSIVVGKFALPAIFFLFSANMKIGSYNWVPIATMLITRLVMIILSGFIAYIARFEPFFSCWGVLGIFLTQSEDLALGIPVINALWDNNETHFGDYAIIHSTVALSTTSLCIALILIGETSQKPQDNEDTRCKSCTKVLSNLLKNQLLLAVLFGCVANLICTQLVQPQLPLFFEGLLSQIASPFGFLALLLMGIGMEGKMSISTFFGRKALFPITLVVTKIILFPVVARAILTALYPSSGLAKKEFDDFENFTFLYGSLPPAVTSVFFAQSFNVMPESIINGMMISLIYWAPYTFITCLIFNMHPVETHDILAQSVDTLSDAMNTLSIITGIIMFTACIFHKPWRQFPMSLIGGLVLCQIMFSLCKLPCQFHHDTHLYSTRYLFYGNCFFRWASATMLVVLSILNALYRTKPRLIYNYSAVWKVITPVVAIVVGVVSVLLPVVSVNNNEEQPHWVGDYHTYCWLWYQSQFDFTLIISALFMVIVVYTLSVSMYHRMVSAREVNKLNKTVKLHKFITHRHAFLDDDDEDKNEDNANIGGNSLQEALLLNRNEKKSPIRHRCASVADLNAFHKEELGIDFCYRLQSLVICELIRLAIWIVYTVYIMDDVNLKPDQSFYELHMMDTFIVDAQGFITFLAFCVSEPFYIFIKKGLHFITCNAFRKTNILSEIVGPSKYTFKY